MDVEHLPKIRRTSCETAIEDAIIKHPDVLGFPDALAIRNFRLAEDSGAGDIVLVPQSGRFRLVLGEAKAASASDAGSKVIGQLLMYFAGALTLGADGIKALQDFAQRFPDEAHSISRTSPQKVIWKVSGGFHPNPHAFELLRKGKRLSPKEVALFVALDNDPHHVLEPLLRMLRDQYHLSIGLVLVRDGKIEVRVPVAG